ncbi:MAG TPA: PAS domain-containing protein, partial [Emcibacteraceae bacterium]|nr:PAS domain-containing protein [Emcibacteraceae bacterium]
MSAVEDLSQERRITFCLYEYWEKLAGESGLPALKNMNRNEIAPFKKNLVLLDLRNGQDNPTFQVIGQDLLEDLDDDLTNKPVSSVPRRTMLSRVTDHYMEVLANRVPIAFEAEFVNKEGEKALYRGILLPFSDDNKNINFILGGVRWILEKDVTLDDTKPTIEELMRQIAQGREDYTPESEQPYDTAASVDEDIPEFAETELNDEILEADVTDAISEPDITAEDEMVIADETYDEDILSEFNADNNAETETAENEDDILALDIEDEDEDEAIAYSEPENETDALDLGNSETDTLDLDSDDYSTELAAEENLEMASLQTPEFEHIAENEDLVFGEDLEEALQSSDLNAEAESDNSHNFEAETTYHEADGHSDKPDSDYQTASPGSLLRKIFIPMDEQTEINISDLDDDDELMLSASENTEEQEDVTESGHHEDNLSSFSALVDAIQNGEEDSETSQDDLTEAEIREDEIAQWPFDNEDHQNPDHLETQDADNSVSEDLQQSVDLENPAEESLLNTVNDEEAQAIERNDLQQGDFDNDEFEDILELTEMAEEEVVSDDSGEPSFSADFDENEEITDFLDVEDTVPFEEDLINELTSVEQIDEKPKTLESLLAEDSTAEELNIESSEELNKSEDADNPEMEQHDESVSSSEDDDGADHGLDYEANADIGSDSEISEPEDISTEENLVEEKLDEDTSDHEEEDLVLTIEEGLHSSFDTAPLDSHEDEFKTDAPEMEQQDEFVVSSEDDDSHDHDLDYEATADIGSDSEISEPEDIITEKIIAEENLVEDTSDHEAEDLVLTTEDDLHSTVDTAPLDSREDNDSAYDDDLSIEELMQSIIAERKFDQAYIREQALREDQEQNEELTKDGQTEETVKASESLTEGTESDYNPDADSPEEDLISISDTKDEILREDQAGLDFVSEYESLFDEYPAAAEIDTPAPNEETDRTSDATVTPETSSEDLEADNQEINVLDD